jgi:plasmid stabilization system protein ParE
MLYYEDRQAGLGWEFVADLEDCIDAAREFPDSGAPWLTGTRRLLFRRFPFALVYLHEESGIDIVAVAHQRREPSYWRDRRA